MTSRAVFLVLLFLLFAAATLSFPAPPVFDRYHSPAEIESFLKNLARGQAQVTEIVPIAVSAGGKPLSLLYIGPEAGKPRKRLPAVLVAANLEGTAPLASEAALFLARLILKKPECRRDKGWYVLALGNPDAAANFFARPLLADARNERPHNDDMDDREDEDGPEDLDGNGIITAMRVKDPEGEWVSLEGEPRLMKKAEAAKGEKGVYKLYSEGLDNDNDGRINEDGRGGVNVGINFPHLFRFFSAEGGRWAGSESASLGLMRFVTLHPEIAMTVTFGASNFCLVPPKGGRKGEADFSKIKIPQQIGAFMGVDTDKTYTMDEIMEIARGVAPPGFEFSESMVAGFLGLGQAVNPLPEDLKYFKVLSDQYKEFLKKGKLDAPRLETPDARDGSFELWSYYHLGVPAFSMDFWTLPEVKKEEKAAPGITPEQLEAMSNEEFVALGEEKITALLKSSGAPEDFKAAMVIDALKGGMMDTKKMAEMMRRMPKPKDSSGGDENERAMLAFSDKELGGRGFIPWKAFRHPTLGEVEIGGFVPFAENTPPAAMIENLLQGQVPWVLELADKLPRLRIAKVTSEALGGGVFRLKAWVENAGYLPFPTAMGDRNKRPAPAVITLEGGELAMIDGLKRTALKEIGGGQTRRLDWIIRGHGGQKVRMALAHRSGWDDGKTIILGESK
ncbi:MAG: hypothetical protein JXO51_00355 [Candidatus Aminicenantes bacterium]|nr:hypothetical protein [Candidatus Aminicenantes bacterium]